MNLQKILPGFLNVSLILHSLKFALVMLVIVMWSRTIVGSPRKYWVDVAAFSYLLPFVLIAEIIVYCTINLTFRMMGDNVLSFLGVILLITMLSAVVVYGIVLKVFDQIYDARSWQRVTHITGYLIVVPVLLIVLNLAFYMGPVGLHAYTVINPTMQGDAKLEKGDYEAAEKLFIKAIQNDSTGMWSSHAHIRLVSVSAQRILKLLPDILGDSGIRERILRNFAQTDPFRRAVNVFKMEGSINVSPAQLIEFREAILHSFLNTGDIPVTSSELDYALKFAAENDGLNELPKDALKIKANTLAQRQQLSYLVYRARALKGEPTTKDAKRYLQFLFELPFRIEVMFVRYRALNLARESQTLAYFDDQHRDGYLARESLIKNNKDIRSHGYKFPHLLPPDSEIEKLSDKELAFHMRQAYLNYLKAEVRLLANSRFSVESSIIRQQVESIEEQLNWISKDAKYIDISQ